MSSTRHTLQRIAAHVLARRRFEVTGRFGLRAAPGGFATPAFGPEPEVVRWSGSVLVREVGPSASAVPIVGRSLRALADFAGTSVDGAFSVGAETPALGDADAPLHLDEVEAGRLAEWWALGWTVLDRAVVGSPDRICHLSEPATVQLWPEHFDAATTVTIGGAGSGDRVNLGFSPGDGYSDEPYLYLGPWTSGRPGPTGYWNAPFGAALVRSRVEAASDAVATCLGFFEEGFWYLSGFGDSLG